jgi:excisionase family DNA binding protein
VPQDLCVSSGTQLDHALTLVVDAVMTRVLSDPRIVASVLHEIRTIVREEIAKASFADRLMDATEAAERLGMTEAALRKAAARGTIPCLHLGRRLRFRLSELMGEA